MQEPLERRQDIEVESLMQPKEVPSITERLETTLVDTLTAAKDYISEGLGAVKEKIIDPITSSLGVGQSEELFTQTSDLRTEEERFKAGLHKVSYCV